MKSIIYNPCNILIFTSWLTTSYCFSTCIHDTKTVFQKKITINKKSFEEEPKTQSNLYTDENINDPYYDTWCQGEVAWDITDNCQSQIIDYMNVENAKSDYISINNQNYLYNNIKNENYIYKKYFENKFHFRMKKYNFAEIYKGFINAAYKDVTKMETIVTNIEQLSFHEIFQKNTEYQLLLFLISSAGLLYSKNSITNINYQNITFLKNSKKWEKIEKHKKYRRNANIIFTVFMTILFRNVKNVE